MNPIEREIAEKEIQTPNDLVKFLQALIKDLVEGRITASEANRVSARVGKRLKALETHLKYGKT